METKPKETKNIYTQLLLAQMEIGAIKKDSDNPFFHSKYVDINGILAAVKPVLNKYGLLLTQALGTREFIGAHVKTGITTEIIFAETKERIVEFIEIPIMTKPQETGSAITYYRRYALQSLLALETEDDDGNAASGNKAKVAVGKHDDKFMADLVPIAEEISLWKVKMENAETLKDLQAVWKATPPMVQDKLAKFKDERKFDLS